MTDDQLAMWIVVTVNFLTVAYFAYKTIRHHGVNMAMWELHLRQDHGKSFHVKKKIMKRGWRAK